MNSREDIRCRLQSKLHLFAVMIMLLVVSMLVPSIHAMAKEEAIPASNISIDYEAQEVSVIVDDNTVIYYNNGTKTAGPKTWETISNEMFTTQTISGQQVKKAIIDISFLSASKESYLYIAGNVSETPTCVTLKAQCKLKAAFVGLLNSTTDSTGAYLAAYSKTVSSNKIYGNFTDETGYFTFTLNGQPYTELDKIQWKKGLSGNWYSLSKLNLNNYTARGAAIYFRVNTGDAPVSTEAKLAYARYAAAPKPAIDSAKLTITLSTKMEYRVKVGSGEYSAWTTPAFDNNKTSGKVNLSSLTGANASSNGNGVSSSFQDMEIQVRVHATEKKTVSKTNTITLYQSDSPVFGTSGLVVNLVDSSNIQKGLKVTNNSDQTYQFAVVNKKVSDSVYGVYKAIEAIDLSTASKQEGYIKLTNIAPGKSATIAYKTFKDFEDDYAVICRTAPIKENTKTAAIEFRLASAFVPVGGDQPKADIATGVVVMDKNQTTVSETITFTVENENSVVYTSIDGEAYVERSDKKVTFTGAKGKTYTIKAYSKNKITGEVSAVTSITLTFVADGELDDYKNEWGYYLCKKEDSEKSQSSRAVLYQRVYLAYTMYTTDVDTSDLALTSTEVSNIVNRVRIDNPELLQATGSLSYYTNTSTGEIQKIVLGMRAKSVVDPLMEECRESLDKIKAAIQTAYGTSPTTLQKVQGIHDYLVLNNQYKSSDMDQTIAGALCSKYTPVCMSYSMAFKYACDALDIQSYVVLGYSGKVTDYHAWNNVNYGTAVTYGSPSIDSSTWCEMDVTWDDPVGGAESYVGYNYFNVTTTFLSANKHTRRYDYYSSYAVEDCTGTAYGYVTNNAVSNQYSDTTTSDMTQEQILKELVKRSGETIPDCTKMK